MIKDTFSLWARLWRTVQNYKCNSVFIIFAWLRKSVTDKPKPKDKCCTFNSSHPWLVSSCIAYYNYCYKPPQLLLEFIVHTQILPYIQYITYGPINMMSFNFKILQHIPKPKHACYSSYCESHLRCWERLAKHTGVHG